MTTSLTFQEFIGLAQENYTKGGMDYVECWDATTFNMYTEMFGPITHKDAMRMFQDSISSDREAIAIANAENW